MASKSEMEQALKDIQNYFSEWLNASGMSEDEFLNYRTCKHFKVLLQDFQEGFAVQLCHEKEQLPIGRPFFVGFQNSDNEKVQYFENTPLILMYMAGKLDKANRENPINGSYGPEYFKERVRGKCPKILEKGQEMVDAKAFL